MRLTHSHTRSTLVSWLEQKQKLFSGLLSTLFAFSLSPAQAVVNGSEILDADVTKPWVVRFTKAECT